MRAAVLERMQIPLPITGYHHGHRSEIGAAISVRSGQIGFETEKAPCRARKDALLLPFEEIAVAIDPVGHPGQPLRRPVSHVARVSHPIARVIACAIMNKTIGGHNR